MTFVQERASVNQHLQFGAESTPGTSVAASKEILCYSMKPGAKVDISMYTPTGRKYASVQELNMEWVESSIDGNMDYNGLPYLIAGAYGLITPAAHGSSSTAKDWISTPTLTGSVQPQTYTVQQGDPNTRAQSWTYGLITKFGYTFDRKKTAVSATMIGQQISDGITMTSTPTIVPLVPVVPSQFNVYLDTSSGSLGNTQLTKYLSGAFSADNLAGPAWFVNRANASYSAHVDLQPTTTFKVLLEADATGMGLLTTMRTGSTVFIRVNTQGPEIDVPNTVYNTFQHDMACKVSNIDPWSDSDGIYAIGFEFTIVEDSGWGKSHMFTVTNLITAL